MKPNFFSLILILLMYNLSSPKLLTAQSPQITVETTGETEAEADLLLFNINITQFHEHSREAFEHHKEQESFLTRLLIEAEIPEKDIFTNPISITPVRRQHDGSGFETRQQVTIRLDDVTRFESMQITLIENGFVNFSGNFSSSKLADAADKALALAVKEAGRIAKILAEAAGKELKEVVHIEYGSRSDISYRASDMAMSLEAYDGSLLQFRQTIPVKENVRVVFRIE